MMIQLQGLLSTITFLDVIDIVVVAYFLYRLFLMLKNTRAATLGKGLMVLIGFTLICRWLNSRSCDVLWSKSAAASCFIRAASWTSRSWRKCWIPLLMPLR